MWGDYFRRRSLLRRANAYQLAVARRYARNRTGWEDHCARTRDLILRFADASPRAEIAILGSGWLFDVPVDELLARGKSLLLYDISHPRQVVDRFAQHPAVRLSTVDLTGGLLELLARGVAQDELPARCRELQPRAVLQSLARACPVVSLNLLSQLQYPVLEFYGRILSPERLQEAATALQAAHLALLGDFQRVLLISDVQEEHFDLRTSTPGPVVPTVYPDVPLREIDSWLWDFDGDGSYARGQRVRLRVKSWSSGWGV